MKRKAVFWTWLCAGALACAAAGEKKTNTTPHEQSGDGQVESMPDGLPLKVFSGGVPNISHPSANSNNNERTGLAIGVKSFQGGIPGENTGLKVLQGMEFLSSRASESHDALLNDGNYFLQLTYQHSASAKLSAIASIYFQQDFVASNATQMAKANRNPGMDQIVKADVIGMQISPRYMFIENQPYFIRADLGGEMARDADENVDDTFNWRSDALVGFLSSNGLSKFSAEIGYGIYEMLPENEWRSIVRFFYMYDLSSQDVHGRVFLTSEFNGIEHSGEEQVRINIGYEMNPEKLFEAIAGIFVDKPKPN